MGVNSPLKGGQEIDRMYGCRNAGGRTSDLTSEMVKTCQSIIGIETCMHLTCTNMPKEKVDIALRVSVLSRQIIDILKQPVL